MSKRMKVPSEVVNEVFDVRDKLEEVQESLRGWRQYGMGRTGNVPLKLLPTEAQAGKVSLELDKLIQYLLNLIQDVQDPSVKKIGSGHDR